MTDTFDPTNPRDLHRLLLMDVDKPARLRALHALRHWYPAPCHYWKDLRWCWTGTESLYREDWDLLSSLWGGPGRGWFMNLAERRALRAMPDSVTVYRGGHSANFLGWSWTLEGRVARWFANRCPMDGQPLVVSVEVPKAAVLAYTRDRNEEEVILDPTSIPTSYHLERLPERQPVAGSLIAQAVQAGTLDVGGPQVLAIALATNERASEAIQGRIHRLDQAGLHWLAESEEERYRQARVIARKLPGNFVDALTPKATPEDH